MQLEIGISTSRYFPASGTAGLDRSRVRGKSRVPCPPPIIMESTLLIFTDVSFGAIISSQSFQLAWPNPLLRWTLKPGALDFPMTAGLFKPVDRLTSSHIQAIFDPGRSFPIIGEKPFGLSFHQRSIIAVERHELFVCALLGNLPVSKDNDFI